MLKKVFYIFLFIYVFDIFIFAQHSKVKESKTTNNKNEVNIIDIDARIKYNTEKHITDRMIKESYKDPIVIFDYDANLKGKIPKGSRYSLLVLSEDKDDLKQAISLAIKEGDIIKSYVSRAHINDGSYIVSAATNIKTKKQGIKAGKYLRKLIENTGAKIDVNATIIILSCSVAGYKQMGKLEGFFEGFSDGKKRMQLFASSDLVNSNGKLKLLEFYKNTMYRYNGLKWYNEYGKSDKIFQNAAEPILRTKTR